MRGFPHLRGICLQRPDLDVQRRTDIYKIVGHERGRTSSAPLRTRQYIESKDFFNRAHREGTDGSHDSLERNPEDHIQVAEMVRIDDFRLRNGNTGFRRSSNHKQRNEVKALTRKPEKTNRV